ncbi:MAG: DUF1015 domain-containing protein [Deltaproteobacteria bacterium]|nr:DUF1015 domain-containing protein [Deltaproteobacteria bacterium]
MAIIVPFRGLTYNFDKLGNLSGLVAPPYDVISEEDQKKYYESNPHNVIRLILGKKKTGDSDWDNRYTRAADCLKRWESEDVLVRADYPSVYLTSHTYDPGDGKGMRVRWGLIALVRIEDEGSGVILPHEKTFSAHKDDRLKLMRACSAQLSQILGLYDDSDGMVSSCLKRASSAPPQVSFDFMDGSSHQMWIVQDHSVFRKVAAAMRDKAIFIADGHHRYETSRNFRNIMRARYGKGSRNRSYEYVMMYLTDMNDPGLTILPSHRLVKKWEGFRRDEFMGKLKQWFEIYELPFSAEDSHKQSRKLKRVLEEKGNATTAIGFHHHNGNNFYILSLKPGAAEEMGEDLQPSLRKLDVLVLSRLVLQRSLGLSSEDMDNEELFHYCSSMRDTLSLVDSGTYELSFLLNHTRMAHVKEVASNSLIMPRKSTYFFPKVMTGLVFNKIEPNETIRVP